MISASDVKMNQSRMVTMRASHDRYWGEIADLCYPDLQSFQSGMLTRSSWVRNQVRDVGTHDAYTVAAVQEGVSLFESYVMPRGQRWQKLELGDEKLMQKVENLQWLEKVELRLFALRNDPRSGFVSAVHDSAMSLFTFGPQSMWVDDRYDPNTGRWAGIQYESEWVGDIWIERDAAGQVMRIHRKIVLNAERAYRKWGDKAPPSVIKAMREGPTPAAQLEIEFIHVIETNREFERGRLDHKGKPWTGAYYCVQDDLVFDVGGYHSLPRLVSAFNRPAQVTYGRSPAMVALPLIRKCMEIERDMDWAAELRLLPPLLSADNELDGAVLEMKPFGVTEGGLDERGNPLIKEFLTASDASSAENIVARGRMLIDKIFYRDLMQMNREYKTHMPAARIEEEKAEKGILLAPLSRQEAEWLSPMTTRELCLMAEAGMMDDMPGEISEYLQDEGTLGLRYDNGLTQLQEAGKSAAFLSLAGQVGALAQFDQTIVEDFKREYPPQRVIPVLGRVAGVPAEMRATEEERAAYDAKKQEEAQAQLLLQAVPALAGAAKDAQMAGAAMPMMGA